MRPTCGPNQLLRRYIDLFFSRFLISGLLNTGITYLIYLGLLQTFSYKIAYTVSFVLGVLISYGLNATFVFRAGVAVSSLLRFPLIYIAQYILGIVLVSVLVEYIGVADWLAPVFVIMITVPLTFVLARTIFLPKSKTELDNVSE